MEIVNIVQTTTVKEITKNAKYIVDFSVINNILQRVQAQMFKLPDDENPNEEQSIGYIYCENKTIQCNISEREGISKLFVDFEKILVEIKEKVMKNDLA